MEVHPFLFFLFFIEIEAHNAQASPARREKPADLPDWERLYISRHCAFPGSVHLPYTVPQEKAHLTLEDTARHARMLYCKILNLPSAKILRIDYGMLTAR